MSNYNWKMHFDHDILQCGKARSQKKIIVICHNEAEEEERRSRGFCKTIRKAQFTFHTLKNTLMVLRCYDEMKKNYSNIIFSICSDTINCPQCDNALQLKRFLQEKSVIHDHDAFQYPLRNKFFWRKSPSKVRKNEE